MSTEKQRNLRVFRKRWRELGFQRQEDFFRARELPKSTFYAVVDPKARSSPTEETLARVAGAFDWTVEELQAKIAEASQPAEVQPAASGVDFRVQRGDETLEVTVKHGGEPIPLPEWAAAVIRPLAAQGVRLPDDREALVRYAYEWIGRNVIGEPGSTEPSLDRMARIEDELQSTSRTLRAIAGHLEPERTEHVPVVGTIAAGAPIEALEDRHGESIVVPARMARRGAYGLRVRGNSMVDDSILDGDTIVVEPCEDVPNGTQAVALLDDGTATLKRVYKEEGRVRLQPANPKLDPVYVDEVRIQGRVRGVVRWMRYRGK